MLFFHLIKNSDNKLKRIEGKSAYVMTLKGSIFNQYMGFSWYMIEPVNKEQKIIQVKPISEWQTFINFINGSFSPFMLIFDRYRKRAVQPLEDCN